MDCNKEEAARAKKIAEEKMRGGDFVGAQKLVTKAQRLFPNLENIMQMRAICDVHSSADKKINGLDYWYGILQVQPLDDADTIKKKYRMLTLLLHPEKNKFAGAEAAFKLVGEANRLLADQIQRSQYDFRYTSHTTDLASKHSNANSGRNTFSTTGAAKKRGKTVEVDGFDVDADEYNKRKKQEEVDFTQHRKNMEEHKAFMVDLQKKEMKHVKPDHFDTKVLAVQWKWKIRTRPSSLQVLSFLQFIVAHRLQSSIIINQDETAQLASSIAHYKEAPKLFQSLGLHNEVPEFVEELMKKGQYIPAVRLIYFFKLQGFCPLHLLRKEITNLRNQAEDKDGGKLRDILELMGDYKLEIDIPREVILKLMDQRPSTSNMAGYDNQILPVLTSTEIHEWLEKTSQQAHEIKLATEQWNNLPAELMKTIEGSLVGKGQGMEMKEGQQRQRSQELQTKVALIAEIESLQKQIVEHEGSKANRTFRATEVARESVTTQQEIDAIAIRHATVMQGLTAVQNQVGDKKAESELTTNLLASTTRQLDTKKETTDRYLRSTEKRLYRREEREKEVAKFYEDDKDKLNKIQRELDYTREHQERLKRKIDRNLDVLGEANDSIQAIISREF